MCYLHAYSAAGSRESHTHTGYLQNFVTLMAIYRTTMEGPITKSSSFTGQASYALQIDHDSKLDISQNHACRYKSVMNHQKHVEIIRIKGFSCGSGGVCSYS